MEDISYKWNAPYDEKVDLRLGLDNNYIHVKWCDVIAFPCHNFNGGLVEWGMGE